MTASSAGGDRKERGSARSLNLLVTREDYAGHVYQLAEAAGKKNIRLRVHLTGAGVLLCKQKDFERLRRRCPVAVCSESAETHGLLGLMRRRNPGLLATCVDLTKSFLSSQHRLIF